MIITEEYINEIIEEELIRENRLKNFFNKIFSKKSSAEPEIITVDDLMPIIPQPPQEPNEKQPQESNEIKNFLDIINRHNAMITNLQQVQSRLAPESNDYKEAQKKIDSIKNKIILLTNQWIESSLKDDEKYQKMKRKKEREEREKRNLERRKQYKKDNARRIAIEKAMIEDPASTPKNIKENTKMKLNDDIIRDLIKEELRKNHKNISNVDEGILGGLKGVVSRPVQDYKVGSLKDDIAKFAQKYQSSLDSISNSVKDFEQRASKLNVKLAPELQNAKGFALTSGEALKNIAGKPEMALVDSSTQQSGEQPKKDEKTTPEGPTGGGPTPGGEMKAGGEQAGPTASAPAKTPESVAGINPNPEKAPAPKSGLEDKKSATAPAAAGAAAKPDETAPAASAVPAAGGAAAPATAEAPKPVAGAEKKSEEAPTAPAAKQADQTPFQEYAAEVKNMDDGAFANSLYSAPNQKAQNAMLGQYVNIKQIKKQSFLNGLEHMKKQFSISEGKGGKGKRDDPHFANKTSLAKAMFGDAGKASLQKATTFINFLVAVGKLPKEKAQSLFGIGASGQQSAPTQAQPAAAQGQGKLSVGSEYADPKQHKMYEKKNLKEHLISRTNNSLSSEQVRRMKLLAGIIK